MQSPGPGTRGPTVPGVLAAALSVLLLLSLAACHGRPLASQMAPAEEGLGRRGQTLSTRGDDAAPQGLRLEGASRLSNPANQMAAWHFRRITQHVAQRDPSASVPSTPKTHARAVLDDALANPAAPAFEGPGKAYMPEGLCVDPIALTLRVVQLLIERGR
jgi:hypothetical protein